MRRAASTAALGRRACGFHLYGLERHADTRALSHAVGGRAGARRVLLRPRARRARLVSHRHVSRLCVPGTSSRMPASSRPRPSTTPCRPPATLSPVTGSTLPPHGARPLGGVPGHVGPVGGSGRNPLSGRDRRPPGHATLAPPGGTRARRRHEGRGVGGREAPAPRAPSPRPGPLARPGRARNPRDKVAR